MCNELALAQKVVKYQVVVRANKLSDGLPNYLKTKYAFHVRPGAPLDKITDDLARELLDLPLDDLTEHTETLL